VYARPDTLADADRMRDAALAAYGASISS